MTSDDDTAVHSHISTELSRDLGLFEITLIGVAAMIGAGIFALVGIGAGLAGPALIAAYLINASFAFITAAVYAELGAAFPEAGGGYLWVKEALPEPNGFYAGWMSWIAHSVACSLYAVTFGSFMVEVVQVAGFGIVDMSVMGLVVPRYFWEKIFAVLMILLFVYINFKGAKETGLAGATVTIIKVGVLMIFIIFGLGAVFGHPDWTVNFLDDPGFMPHGVWGILTAVGLTTIAFEGFEIIVQSGEEVKDPDKNIPKAIFITLGLVVSIYLLIAFVTIGGLEPPGGGPSWVYLGNAGELGLIEAAGEFMPYGAIVLLIAGLVATMSACNATIFSSSRVSFAMGRGKDLPDIFSRVHSSFKTPHWAVWLSGVVIVVMAMFPIEAVAAGTDIMFILLFLQVMVTLIMLRRKRPDLNRPFMVPKPVLLMAIGIVGHIIFLVFLITGIDHGFVALLTMMFWLLLGIGIYMFYSRPRRETELKKETPTVVSKGSEVSGKDYQVLVPVKNLNNMDELVHAGIDLARKNDGEVLVLSVLAMPEQTPLEEGYDFIEENEELISRAVKYSTEEVPVRGVVSIGHSVSRGIINMAERYESDFILMGWRGRGFRQDVILGSNLDEVIRKAPCDVGVTKLMGPIEPKKIVLPITGDIHENLAINTAEAFGSTYDSEITVIHVVDKSPTEEELNAAYKLLEETSWKLSDLNVETKILKSGKPAEAIIKETEECDLLIMGAIEEGLLQQIVLGSLPETLAKKVDCDIFMVRRHTGITSLVKYWLGTKWVERIFPASNKKRKK